MYHVAIAEDKSTLDTCCGLRSCGHKNASWLQTGCRWCIICLEWQLHHDVRVVHRLVQFRNFIRFGRGECSHNKSSCNDVQHLRRQCYDQRLPYRNFHWSILCQEREKVEAVRGARWIKLDYVSAQDYTNCDQGEGANFFPLVIPNEAASGGVSVDWWGLESFAQGTCQVWNLRKGHQQLLWHVLHPLANVARLLLALGSSKGGSKIVNEWTWNSQWVQKVHIRTDQQFGTVR